MSTAASMAQTVVAKKSRPQWMDVWREFRKNLGAVVGMIVFIAIVLLVTIGPMIYRVDPAKPDYKARSDIDSAPFRHR
ncbi:MAG: hypothetical protein R2865_12675 [Deinococcales bacterium]